jgi:hypothetical protein
MVWMARYISVVSASALKIAFGTVLAGLRTSPTGIKATSIPSNAKISTMATGPIWDQAGIENLRYSGMDEPESKRNQHQQRQEFRRCDDLHEAGAWLHAKDIDQRKTAEQSAQNRRALNTFRQ